MDRYICPTSEVHLSRWSRARHRPRHRNLWCPISVAVNEPPPCFSVFSQPAPPKTKKTTTKMGQLDFVVSLHLPWYRFRKLFIHEVAPVSALAKAPSQCELFHPPVRDNCCDILLSHLAMRQWQKLEKFQSCNAQGTQNPSHYMAIG